MLLYAVPLFAQSNSGELRLKVTDPAGLGVKTAVQIISEANQYRNTLTTSDQGSLDVQRLPYGIYQLEIQQPGFARRIRIRRDSFLDSDRTHDPTQAAIGERNP